MPSESICVKPARPTIAVIVVCAYTEKEDAHIVEQSTNRTELGSLKALL